MPNGYITLVYAINNSLIHWCDPYDPWSSSKLSGFLFLLPQWQCLRWKWTPWERNQRMKFQIMDMDQREL